MTCPRPTPPARRRNRRRGLEITALIRRPIITLSSGPGNRKTPAALHTCRSVLASLASALGSWARARAVQRQRCGLRVDSAWWVPTVRLQHRMGLRAGGRRSTFVPKRSQPRQLSVPVVDAEATFWPIQRSDRLSPDGVEGLRNHGWAWRREQPTGLILSGLNEIDRVDL